ncbi:MAG: hypothetical protein WCD70_16535 [Alphaproteobacteria bacterium]
MTAITEQNFPLYPLLLTNNQTDPHAHAMQARCVEDARKGFETAQSSDDEAVFDFVLGIQTVALWPEPTPGQTDEIIEKTLQSSRAVFEELAKRGHSAAKDMVDYYDANGIGLPKPNTGNNVPNPKLGLN